MDIDRFLVPTLLQGRGQEEKRFDLVQVHLYTIKQKRKQV